MEAVFFIAYYLCIYIGVPLGTGLGFYALFRLFPILCQSLLLFLGFFNSIFLLVGWNSLKEKNREKLEHYDEFVIPWRNCIVPWFNFICIIIATLVGIIGFGGRKAIPLSAGFSWGFLFWQMVWQETMLRGSTVLGFEISFERFLYFLIWIRYLFKRGSAMQVISERRGVRMEKERQQEYERRKRKYEGQDEGYAKEIEEKEKQLAAIYKQYPDILTVPEVLHSLSEDLQYKGFLGEITRRFEDKQIMKTTITRTAAVAKVIQLIETMAQLRKARASLYAAFYEAEEKERETKVRYKKMQEGEIEKHLEREMKIADLESEQKVAKLRTGIQKEELEQAQIRAQMRELESKPVASGSKEEDWISKQIKAMEKRHAGIEEVRAARDRCLSRIDPKQDPELYSKSSNMWDSFIMELMERRGNVK